MQPACHRQKNAGKIGRDMTNRSFAGHLDSCATEPVYAIDCGGLAPFSRMDRVVGTPLATLRGKLRLEKPDAFGADAASGGPVYRLLAIGGLNALPVRFSLSLRARTGPVAGIFAFAFGTSRLVIEGDRT